MNFHRHLIRTRGKMTGERISKQSFKRKGLSNPNYREKITFKNKGKVMTFSDKEKLKDFFATIHLIKRLEMSTHHVQGAVLARD